MSIRKDIEVEHHTIIPRERAQNSTSGPITSSFENDRRHGFAGANVPKKRHFLRFVRILRNGKCDYSITTAMQHLLLRTKV